jgi:hypothetical protein
MDSKLILEAIALRRCIAITYNRTRMKLAPHVLYTRHGDLFLDAVAVEREGKAPEQTKLGTFKVAGLQIPELTGSSFLPLPGFDRNDSKYQETTPFTV